MKNVLRVLSYHRIAEEGAPPWLSPRLVSATPGVFARQMKHLARHYHVVSMERVLDAVLQGTSLPKRAVLLTFDDAYVDFGQVAWPILRSLGLPATLFVVTAHASDTKRRFWWDRLYHCVVNCASTSYETATGSLSLGSLRQRTETVHRIQALVKSMPHAEGMRLIEEICSQFQEPNSAPVSTMGWDELRQLAREGVTLGAHTQTHPILTQLAAEEVRAEVASSQQDLLPFRSSAIRPAGITNPWHAFCVSKESFSALPPTLARMISRPTTCCACDVRTLALARPGPCFGCA